MIHPLKLFLGNIRERDGVVFEDVFFRVISHVESLEGEDLDVLGIR